MCGTCNCDHSHGQTGLESLHLESTEPRTIRLEQAILGRNDALAAQNRAAFEAQGVLALNLLSSPGSGKTTLLCETIRALDGRLPTAVIEGDQETSFDADRIRETGSPAVQINTGKGCHLDASMIAGAVTQLAPVRGSVLFIENVGNLVCPAAFDLGEAARVVVLSVTEGDDKPLKYPDMFANADLMILNKIDLLPYLRFDVFRCLEMAQRINPGLKCLQLSAATGAGFDAWLEWIATQYTAPRRVAGH